jgi:hypothetical protein
MESRVLSLKDFSNNSLIGVLKDIKMAQRKYVGRKSSASKNPKNNCKRTAICFGRGDEGGRSPLPVL